MSVSEVKLIAAGLEDGESVREVCPFCLGGTSGERSLNVSVLDGMTLWNCHRASCLEKGGTGAGRQLVRTSQRTPKVVNTPYEGELTTLPDVWTAYLEEKIGWGPWHRELGRPRLAVAETHAEDRVAFPIFSPMGVRRGYVLRSYERFPKYKTLTRMDLDEPHLSWYRPSLGIDEVQDNSSVVVVEDIPSAVRAARYTDSVALCGGGLGLEYATEIAAHYDNVVWALDADATVTAIALCNRFRILFGGTSTVLVLERDMKDMNEEELCRLFKPTIISRGTSEQ